MAELADAAVYRKLLGARIRSDLQYRVSMLLRLGGSALLTALDIVVIVLLFGRVRQIEGWTLAEVAFLYGASGVAFDIADIFVGGVEWLFERVKQGTFDRMLVRPLSPLAQLAIEEFTIRRVGRLIQSTTVLCIAIAALDIDWTPARAALMPAMILAGIGIYGAVFVASTSLAFWTVEAREFCASVTYGGNYLSQYPVTIYGEWFRRLLAFAVPMAFVSYFPSLYILGRNTPADRFGLPSWIVFSSPLAALAAIVVARLVWRRGVRRYRSTGS